MRLSLRSLLGGDSPAVASAVALSIHATIAFLLTLPATWLGLRLQREGVAVLLPTAGVVLGVLLGTAGRARLASLVGALAAVSLGHALAGRSFIAAGVVMGTLALQTAGTVWLIERFGGPPFRLETLRNVAIFVAAVVAANALVGGLVSVGQRAAGHGGEAFTAVWLTWSAAEIVGILALAPAVLALRAQRAGETLDLEGLAQAALVGLAGLLLIDSTTRTTSALTAWLAAAAAALLGLWIAARGSVLRAALSLLSLSAVTIWAAGSRYGALVDHPIAAQIVLTLAAAVLLTLGAVRATRPELSFAVLSEPSAARSLQVASILVPLALFAMFAAWSYETALADARHRAERVVTAMAEHARRVFEVQETMLLSVLDRARGIPFDKLASHRGLQAFMAELDHATPSSLAIIAIRPDTGRIAASSRGEAGDTDLSQRDYVRAHAAGVRQPYFGEVVRSNRSETIGFTMSRRDADTGLIAVTLLSVEAFHSYYRDLQSSNQDLLTLVRDDLSVLASTFQPVGRRLRENGVAARLVHGELSGQTIGHSAVTGVERLFTLGRLADTPIYMIHGLSMAGIRAGWMRQLLPFGSLSLLAAALLFGLTRTLERSAITRHRAEVAAVAQQSRADLMAQSERQLRLFIDQAPVAMAMFDREMRYLAANRRWIADYRLDGSPVGRLYYELCPEIDDEWTSIHRLCLAGATERSESQRFVRADGSEQFIRWEARPWRYPDRSIGGLLIATEDISAPHRAENALRASEARYRAAFDIANVGKVEVDAASGRFILVNDAYCDIVGYSRDELLGMGPAELIHPDDRARDGPLVSAFFRGETDTYTAEKRFIRKDGRTIWVSVSCALVRDATGKPLHSAGVLTDITERAAAEDSLRRHAERQGVLLELTAALIETRDPDDLGPVVFESVRHVLDADVCLMYRHEARTGRLELAYHHGVPPEALDAARQLRLDQAFCGGVAANCRACTADRQRIKSDPKGALVRSFGVTAYACQPLLASDGGVFGTFSLGSTRRERFSGDEIAWLETLANILAQAWQRSLGERTVRERELHLRLAMDASASLTFEWDITRDRVRRLYSHEPALPQTEDASDTFASVTSRIHPEDRERFRKAVFGPIERRETIYRSEHRIVRPDGSERWLTEHGRLDYDQDGRPRRLIGVSHDITELKTAEEALRVSELRFRRAADAARALIYSVPLSRSDERAAMAYGIGHILGEEPDVVTSDWWHGRIHPDDLGPHLQELERCNADRTCVDYHAEYRLRHADGSWRTVADTGQILRLADGTARRLVGTILDVTERKRHEAQVHLLMREVNHRSKNLLTVVQAIARRTAAASPKDFVERFSERLQALAANQDLLVANEWRGVGVEELVRAQLAHFTDLIGSRIRLSGPAIRVSAPAAQALGMALHELATNAGKYGALSNEAGVVDIAWRIDGGDQQRFSIGWSEHGGPPVKPPKRHGFGTTVVSTAAKASLNGEVELDYRTAGVDWRLECPASEALERTHH